MIPLFQVNLNKNSDKKQILLGYYLPNFAIKPVSHKSVNDAYLGDSMHWYFMVYKTQLHGSQDKNMDLLPDT